MDTELQALLSGVMRFLAGVDPSELDFTQGQLNDALAKNAKLTVSLDEITRRDEADQGSLQDCQVRLTDALNQLSAIKQALQTIQAKFNIAIAYPSSPVTPVDTTSATGVTTADTIPVSALTA